MNTEQYRHCFYYCLLFLLTVGMYYIMFTNKERYEIPFCKTELCDTNMSNIHNTKYIGILWLSNFILITKICLHYIQNVNIKH